MHSKLKASLVYSHQQQGTTSDWQACQVKYVLRLLTLQPNSSHVGLVRQLLGKVLSVCVRRLQNRGIKGAGEGKGRVR